MRVQGFKGPRVQATTRNWEIFDGVLGEEMKMRFSVWRTPDRGPGQAPESSFVKSSLIPWTPVSTGVTSFFEFIKNKKQKERKRWLKSMCIFLEQEKRMGPPKCARFWVARAAIWRK
jgi:hypothetical protein